MLKASYLSEIKNENEPPLYNNQISSATLNQVVFDELPIINDLYRQLCG